MGAVLIALTLGLRVMVPAGSRRTAETEERHSRHDDEHPGLRSPDILIPLFEKKTGYFVKTIAVGSGQAMAMGQKGEADVLLVHSQEAEKEVYGR